MDLKERTVKVNYVYQGKIVNLRCDEAALPDGKPCKREMVEHPGGASVLCVYKGKVALVRQFRYAYQEELLEIPAGKLERGEDPMLAAKRELEEETGLVASELKPLFTLYPTPGYTNEKIYIYEASGVTLGKQHLDEGEFLNVVFLPVEEVARMIEKREIRDAKTIVAVQSYLLKNK